MPEFADLKSWRETLDALPAPVVARGPFSTLRQEVHPGYLLLLRQDAPDGPWSVYLGTGLVGEGQTQQEAMQEATDVLEAALSYLQETPALLP